MPAIASSLEPQDPRYRSSKCAHSIVSAIIIFTFCLFSCTAKPNIFFAPEKHLYLSEYYAIYPLKETDSLPELAQRFLHDSKKAWLIEEANPGYRFYKGEYVAIPLKDCNNGGLNAYGFQTVPHSLQTHSVMETPS